MTQQRVGTMTLWIKKQECVSKIPHKEHVGCSHGTSGWSGGYEMLVNY